MDKIVQVNIQAELLKELNDLFNPTDANYDFSVYNQRKRELYKEISVSAMNQWVRKSDGK